MATAIYDAATVPALPGPPAADVPGGASETGLHPHVAIVGDGVPAPGEAFVALRQGRLRATAAFLAALASLFAALFLAGGDALGLFHGGAAPCLWAAFAWLSSRTASRGALRVAEYGVFGVMTANLVAGQYVAMFGTATHGEPLEFLRVVDTTLVGSILLMFAYTMLIPNTGRAALGPVGLFLLAPALTALVLCGRHPEVLRFASERAVSIFGNPVLGLAAAGLAVYGAHVLSTLRQEVFEARRLNQYRLRGRLGAGGMGEVHLAEHHLLRRLCAVKLIRPDAAGDRRALERFEREVRATARLAHPNIVEIYDYGLTDEGTFYYVMEYLRGSSLDKLVADRGPLPYGRAVYLLRQACDGLAEAHAAGLVHRDVKPGNVLVACVGTRADVVKLLDFGLVKDPSAGAHDPEGEVSGTPQYMAPEQVAADPALDGRCDIYSLGAVAYFMLTGHPPFTARNAVDVMLAHAHRAVEPPSAHRPGLPADLEAVVPRCLEKDPASRYPDALALKAALDARQSAGEWDAAHAALWWRQVKVTPPSPPNPTRR
ncbi:MAG TPA: serine/threonine-protein kinase, partial [Isosphaeraceae bacterium]|jgi:serine/threonine-protein kinase